MKTPSSTSSGLKELRSLWKKAQQAWQREGLCYDPLQEPNEHTKGIETKIKRLISVLLRLTGEAREKLHASARKTRDADAGKHIALRAVVEASNVCRANCAYCPMRRDNLGKSIVPTKITARQIIVAADAAHKAGIRNLFIQSGEDRHVVRSVRDAIVELRRTLPDFHIVLNLGDLEFNDYKALTNAGADGYLIKHETANPVLHGQMRPHSTLSERVRHMLLARKAGMYIGTGTIVGLPGQTTEDLAEDVLFAGKIGSYQMVSCSPFTPSPYIPLRNHPAGDFYTSLNLIAIYRHLFTEARIPAPSNFDSPLLESRPSDLRISGQAAAINAGANGITINYTPKDARDAYSIYDTGAERHVVLFEKAKTIADETGLPLDLCEHNVNERAHCLQY